MLETSTCWQFRTDADGRRRKTQQNVLGQEKRAEKGTLTFLMLQPKRPEAHQQGRGITFTTLTEVNTPYLQNPFKFFWDPPSKAALQDFWLKAILMSSTSLCETRQQQCQRLPCWFQHSKWRNAPSHVGFVARWEFVSPYIAPHTHGRMLSLLRVQKREHQKHHFSLIGFRWSVGFWMKLEKGFYSYWPLSAVLPASIHWMFYQCSSSSEELKWNFWNSWSRREHTQACVWLETP